MAKANQQAATEAKAEAIRKITVKEVFGAINMREIFSDDMDAKSPAVPLFKVAGVATRAVQGESNYGTYTKFKGDFIAVTEAGKKYTSANLILPGVVSDSLEVAIDQLANGDKAEVEFAFQIGVKISARDANKYEYTATPLLKIQRSDAMAKLENVLTENPVQKLIDDKQPAKK